jgi:YesN/AraC family two-component response regulator
MKEIEGNNRIAVSLEKIEKASDSSFHTGVYKQPHFSGNWHYHPEFEILLITGGNGKRLVGDHVEDFDVNDLVLLGGYLPHAWIPDSKYLAANSEEFCESIYMQFHKNIFGTNFVDVPELKGVRKVLRLAERGLKIEGKHKEKIMELLKSVPKKSSFELLLKLLEILNLISVSDFKQLASENYVKKSFYFKSSRVVKIHEYLMEHYKEDIPIKFCADMANMTVASFCRFFKTETQETFTSYLNKIRIDFSKKILANTDMPIKEIAYECGYNSVPYFNKQFKKIEGSSPFSYRKSQEKKE